MSLLSIEALRVLEGKEKCEKKARDGLIARRQGEAAVTPLLEVACRWLIITTTCKAGHLERQGKSNLCCVATGSVVEPPNARREPRGYGQ